MRQGTRTERTSVKNVLSVGAEVGRRRRYDEGVALRDTARRALLHERRAWGPEDGAFAALAVPQPPLPAALDALRAELSTLTPCDAAAGTPKRAAELARGLGMVLGSTPASWAPAARCLAEVLRAAPSCAEQVAGQDGVIGAACVRASARSSLEDMEAALAVLAACAAPRDRGAAAAMVRAGSVSAMVGVLADRPAYGLVRSAVAVLRAVAEATAPDAGGWGEGGVDVALVLGAAAALMQEQPDGGVLEDVCHLASAVAAAAPVEALQSALTRSAHHPTRLIVELLAGAPSGAVLPCIRFLGGVAALGGGAAAALDAMPAVEVLCGQLAHPGKAVRREACWALSNIAAGRKEAVQRCLEGGLVPPLLTAVAACEATVRREAAWALCNLTAHATPRQHGYLAAHGAAPQLLAVLRAPDAALRAVVLHGLLRLCAAPCGLAARHLHDEGAVPLLLAIQDDDNAPPSIRDAAAALAAAVEAAG